MWRGVGDSLLKSEERRLARYRLARHDCAWRERDLLRRRTAPAAPCAPTQAPGSARLGARRASFERFPSTKPLFAQNGPKQPVRKIGHFPRAFPELSGTFQIAFPGFSPDAFIPARKSAGKVRGKLLRTFQNFPALSPKFPAPSRTFPYFPRIFPSFPALSRGFQTFAFQNFPRIFRYFPWVYDP